ncbi:hypothetical protein VR44_30965 [Streptomyces katrae]|uniref:Uncharacterized protein n=1 Tax=Streptomyces katrae TaxID=68223 RepID=A0A0F4IWN1_9ACTN|nr:hypothetical protein VR44_30965 [Streptomyces katrae]
MPELCAVLPQFQYAATAITAVAVGPEQREQAATALRADARNLFVAKALHELTGETDRLFAAAEAALATGARGGAEGARALADLGPAAARLTPALRTVLHRTTDRDTTPELDTDLGLALALWRITGDAAEAVPVLASVFDRSEGQQWFALLITAALRRHGVGAQPTVDTLRAARNAHALWVSLAGTGPPGRWRPGGPAARGARRPRGDPPARSRAHPVAEPDVGIGDPCGGVVRRGGCGLGP